MSKRVEVRDTILSWLKSAFPDIAWSTMHKGAQRGSSITGSLVNDRISYTYDTKNSLVAKAEYYIILIDPNNMDTVDALADGGFELLDSDDLDGVAIESYVREVIYGAAPQKADAGAVMLRYEVFYYV
nr:MAG TPA: Minor tail protein U Alpha-Beta fold, VIRAL PROTEIN [Caudoviricetes sp.]